MNEWLDLTFSALAARQTCLGLALAWLDRPALRAIVLLACGVGLRGALPSILIYRGKIGFVAGLPRLSSGEASVDQVLYWLLPGSIGELFGRWSSGLWVGLRGALPSIPKLKGFDGRVVRVSLIGTIHGLSCAFHEFTKRATIHCAFGEFMKRAGQFSCAFGEFMKRAEQLRIW